MYPRTAGAGFAANCGCLGKKLAAFRDGGEREETLERVLVEVLPGSGPERRTPVRRGLLRRESDGGGHRA